MWRTETLVILAVVLTSVGVCWSGSNAVEPNPPPEALGPALPTTAGPAALRDAAWMEELSAIRRQLGGDDVVRDQAAFLEELRGLAKESPPPVAPAEPAAVEANRATWRAPQNDDEELITALRRAASLLDEKANRIEFQQAYSQADDYRKLASRLRREARHLAETPPER